MSSTTPHTSHVDVLIIGAGPAGLMSALALSQAGVSVKIVDQRPTSVVAGQADGVMPRTVEVLQSYGLAEPLLKQGNRVNIVAFYNLREEGGVKRTGRVPMITSPDARYPYCTTLNQGSVETIFVERLLELGVAVDRPTRPSSLVVSSDEKELKDANAYPIKAVLDHLDANNAKATSEIIHAKFAIGADGAHSWVRKALGIVMEGEQTDHVWGAIDFTTTPESNFPDWRNICTINAANTTILSIPREGNKMRLYLDLGLEHGLVDTASGRVVAQHIDAKRLLDIAKLAVKPYTVAPDRIDWWTAYIVGQRVAEKFSVHERAFIAGDACHTHSPKAGQGMNVSMMDGHNLGWKLAQVIHGRAQFSLLKTYELERRKFAQELIAFDTWYEAGFSVKARSELFEKEKANSAPLEPFEAFRAFSGLTSGTGIKYSESIITHPTAVAKSLASGLEIGYRLPPHIVLYAGDFTPVDIHDLCPSDTRFKVLVFPGDISSTAQSDALKKFADEFFAPGGVLCKWGSVVGDVLTFLKGEKETVDYFEVPHVLRPDWKKILLDARDATETKGGKLYETYGVRPEGALAVIRPDGYIGLVVALDQVKEVEKYFSGFLTA